MALVSAATVELVASSTPDSVASVFSQLNSTLQEQVLEALWELLLGFE